MKRKVAVMDLLQKRNQTNLTSLEKACDDAVSIFNQTIVKLEQTTEQYKALESDIDNEISELIHTKDKITSKIYDISRITAKFKDFLS